MARILTIQELLRARQTAAQPERQCGFIINDNYRYGFVLKFPQITVIPSPFRCTRTWNAV